MGALKAPREKLPSPHLHLSQSTPDLANSTLLPREKQIWRLSSINPGICCTFRSTLPPSKAFFLQKPNTKRIHPADESAQAAFPGAPREDPRTNWLRAAAYSRPGAAPGAAIGRATVRSETAAPLPPPGQFQLAAAAWGAAGGRGSVTALRRALGGIVAVSGAESGPERGPTFVPRKVNVV